MCSQARCVRYKAHEVVWHDTTRGLEPVEELAHVQVVADDRPRVELAVSERTEWLAGSLTLATTDGPPLAKRRALHLRDQSGPRAREAPLGLLERERRVAGVSARRRTLKAVQAFLLRLGASAGMRSLRV